MQTRTLEYKILCEVHILHDYFLIDSNNASFFALNPEQKQFMLTKKLQIGAYDIQKMFLLLINKENAALFQNFKLRLLPTALGFNVAMEVKSFPQSDGSVRYRPAILPPVSTTFSIGLNSINALFGNITSITLNNTDPYIYQFSNIGTRSPNSLSLPVPDYSANKLYQMGDLAVINGQVQQALERLKGNRTKWRPVAGAGFVNDADRTLDTTTDEFKDWKLGFSTPMTRPFGMIQLQFFSPDPNNALLTEDGFLLTRRISGARRATPKRFELRFLSRPTYWRYAKATGFEQDEINLINGSLSSFFEWKEGRIVTRKPRYFTQGLTYDESGKAFPNAQPNSLRAEDGRFYSDIYFNAINVFPK